MRVSLGTATTTVSWAYEILFERILSHIPPTLDVPLFSKVQLNTYYAWPYVDALFETRMGTGRHRLSPESCQARRIRIGCEFVVSTMTANSFLHARSASTFEVAYGERGVIRGKNSAHALRCKRSPSSQSEELFQERKIPPCIKLSVRITRMRGTPNGKFDGRCLESQVLPVHCTMRAKCLDGEKHARNHHEGQEDSPRQGTVRTNSRTDPGTLGYCKFSAQYVPDASIKQTMPKTITCLEGVKSDSPRPHILSHSIHHGSEPRTR